jgi:hypothetical protein
VVRAQLEETTREMQKLRNILGKASATIQASLQPPSPQSGHLHSVSGAGVATRENLLATLLQLMNFDPSTSPSRQVDKQSSPVHTLHYTPGDLGFVPAAKAKKRVSNEPLLITGARTPLPPIASSGTPTVVATTAHKPIATQQ